MAALLSLAKLLAPCATGLVQNESAHETEAPSIIFQDWNRLHHIYQRIPSRMAIGGDEFAEEPYIKK